jgi:hypothetical protein
MTLHTYVMDISTSSTVEVGVPYQDEYPEDFVIHVFLAAAYSTELSVKTVGLIPNH